MRIGVVNGPSGQHVIAALRKLEGLPGRPPPGTLLLAQDPRSLNRCVCVLAAWVEPTEYRCTEEKKRKGKKRLHLSPEFNLI